MPGNHKVMFLDFSLSPHCKSPMEDTEGAEVRKIWPLTVDHGAPQNRDLF